MMNDRKLTSAMIQGFGRYLHEEELSCGTIQKYLRDVRAFAGWLDGRDVNKELATQWKEPLVAQGYAAATVNSMLAAVNTLCRFADWPDCRVKFLKIQRRIFRAKSRELTAGDYRRLVNAALCGGRERLALLLETLGATGIRVSEVAYITVEAAAAGRAVISLKGKIRTILLASKLCRKLLKYARKNEIASGEIFITRSGKGLSRKQIWAEMKGLCQKAGVEATKVFPHNLRHLFATAFYRASKDIARLADVLGHSSVETTRIYLITTGAEHMRQLDRLDLVL